MRNKFFLLYAIDFHNLWLFSKERKTHQKSSLTLIESTEFVSNTQGHSASLNIKKE